MKDNRKQITEIIEDMGGAGALAMALHVSTAVVCNWRNRGIIPRRYWLDIIKASGGQVTANRLLGVVE